MPPDCEKIHPTFLKKALLIHFTRKFDLRTYVWDVGLCISIRYMQKCTVGWPM